MMETETKELDRFLAGTRAVMMCGVSGSGKTFLARRLEAMGWIRLSADLELWRIYGAEYRSFSPEKQRSAYMQANKDILAQIPALLAQGKRIVIDAPMCSRDKRDNVRTLCANAGADCLTVYLSADKDELMRRLSLRHGTGPDDQLVSASELERFLSGFEAPEADENFIHIANNTAVTKA